LSVQDLSAFPLAGFLVGTRSRSFGGADAVTLVLTIVGGCGVGSLSTLANGCPFRQHALAAQGVRSSFAYLAGAVIFHVAITPRLFRLLP
jgi:uncharacterized membrane protein YedE/YeeE